MERSVTARDVRYEIQVPVGMAWKGDSRIGLTENISVGGLFAATTRPGRVGDQVQLRLKFAGVGKWLEVSAEIRWVRRDPEPGLRHGARGMGLMFTHVPSTVATLVRELISGGPPDRVF
jgi:uncharacterized protein (TIGR02266 family)